MREAIVDTCSEPLDRVERPPLGERGVIGNSRATSAVIRGRHSQGGTDEAMITIETLCLTIGG